MLCSHWTQWIGRAGIGFALGACGASTSDERNASDGGPERGLDSSTEFTDAARADAALEGVERYFDAFSSRDLDQLQGALAMPLLTATFPNFTILGTAAEYAEPLWSSLEQSGWKRSQIDSAEVVLESSDAAYVDTRYSRLLEDGSVLTHGRGVYGLTGASGEFRVQSVIGISTWLADSQEPLSEPDPAAEGAVADYIAALNAHDVEQVRAHLLFPFVRIDAAGVESTDDAATFDPGLDGLQGRGWSQSRVASVQAVAATVSFVLYAVAITCHDAAGAMIGEEAGIYSVVHDASGWRIQAIGYTEGPC